jgi:MYXO-CTERM domain-containing protein
MKPRFLATVVLGSSLLGGAAIAEPFIGTFEVHDDMHAGALWRNDRPNNNNQRGAGGEHESTVLLAGGRILVVATASYTNVIPMVPGAGLSSLDAGVLAAKDGDPGVQAQGNRVEGLCAAYQLDSAQGLAKMNMSYFTKNDSPDWQNMHKPHIQAIDGGAAALVQYGYDPDGTNTSVYGMVLGPNCEVLSKQTKLFANTNDNLGGLWESSNNTYADAGGVTLSCGGNIGNGNGTDDVWAHCTTTTKTTGTGENTYTLKPEFKIVLDNKEERSRGTTQPTPFANKMLACWASGDAQPPDSVRCGMVNVAPGVPNDQRLVWRQFVMQRKNNLHYTTPSLVPLLDPAGKPTDKYIVTYVMVDTTNRNGRAKGRTVIQSVPMQITETGMKLLDTPKENLFGLTDGSHPGMSPGYYGVDRRPVAFLFNGTITDGGGAAAKIIGLTADNKLEGVRALNWADASSGGYTSLWYGHNPNTPQGRSYPVTSIVVDNPGYGKGYQPDVKSFLVVSNAHHKKHDGECGTGDPNKGTNNGTCGGKNALSIVLVPIAADAPKGNPTDPDDPNPVDPTAPGGDPSDPGTTLGGCAAGGGSGAGGLVLLGFALVALRRRRSN